MYDETPTSSQKMNIITKVPMLAGRNPFSATPAAFSRQAPLRSRHLPAPGAGSKVGMGRDLLGQRLL